MKISQGSFTSCRQAIILYLAQIRGFFEPASCFKTILYLRLSENYV